VGVFIGTLLAVGFAMLRELLVRRLRTTEDVVAELKQPLLVMLPVAAHAKKKGPDNKRVSMVKARMLAGLPRPATKV